MYIFLCITLLFTKCYAQLDPLTGDTNICTARNAYYKVEGSCDVYVECLDYQPSRMLCPDGLNYNPEAIWPMYPCSYPADVPCIDREVSQPPNPTADCPRQHGFFRSPTSTTSDCGRYRLCSDGHAFEMYCPYGLAFNEASGRCDWPDAVPGCSPEEFLSFTCPAPTYDTMGYPLISNYRYENDCYMFYSCQDGYARLLSCDPGFAFDADQGICVNADQVNCVPYIEENTVSEIENE